jgi:hypothetical protein
MSKIESFRALENVFGGLSMATPESTRSLRSQRFDFLLSSVVGRSEHVLEDFRDDCL